ncbi:MAG: Ni/Fe hydrogenase subunit alpha, partial [Candidatus Bipolaricaulota bacterium]
MSESEITIDPITRLEGHGKIRVFLDQDRQVNNAVLQVPELRGFERFCQGRRGEEMPRLTERICGVCPEAHHFASTKALDHAFSVKPNDRARKLRELLYNAYIYADHSLHLFYLGGPDFLVDRSAGKASRNIVGVLDKIGDDLGKSVLKHRRFAHEIIEEIGGHQVHPVSGVPGGMSKSVDAEARKRIEEQARSCLDFAQESVDLFHNQVFDDELFGGLVEDQTFSLSTYYMGLVDEDSRVSFYDGDVKVISPSGDQFALVSSQELPHIIEEHVEPWTYVKFPYLKEVGWNDFRAGQQSGVFRVGPLARLNVAEGMKNPKAQEEYLRFSDFFGGTPVHHTYAYHWARLVELLDAAESMYKLASDPDIAGGGLRTELGQPGEGVGVIEAARGTLIHHYSLDERGLVESANMVVPTTSNNAALSMSIGQAASAALNGKRDYG